MAADESFAAHCEGCGLEWIDKSSSVTAPDPRLDEIQARLSADWEASMSGGYIGDDQCMKDRDFLLAELRKAREALERVEEIADLYRFTIMSRDIRAAVAAAKGDERG